MIRDASITSDIFRIDRFPRRMLACDLCPVVPDCFSDLVDQIFGLRFRRDQMHRADIQAIEISIESFVSPSRNGGRVKERIVLDQRLTLVLIKRHELDIEGAGCLSDGTGWYGTAEESRVS